MRGFRFLTLALVLLTLSADAFAITQLINIQGKVTDANGDLVDGGNLVVYVYNASTGGTPIYNSTTNFNSKINNGVFNVLVGSVTSLDLDYGQAYWLDFEVNNKDLDWDGSERTQFASAVGEITGSAISTLNDTANFRGLSGAPDLINITNPGTRNTIQISHSGATGSVVNISTSTADSAIYIDQGGYTNDGSVYIENTDNSGSALKIYSNKGAANSALLYLHADNTAFDQHVLHVKNDGTGNAIQVDGTINATAFSGNGSALSNMLAIPTKAVNGDFWHWLEGTNVKPTWWNISGSGATAKRNTTCVENQYGWKSGTATGYSMALTRVTNEASVHQTWSASGIRLHSPFLGKKLSMTARVNASVASRARIGIVTEGGASPGSTFSAYHSGGEEWETLSVSRNIPSDATSITLNISVDGGDTTAFFSQVQANVGEPQQFVPGGITSKWIMDDAELGNNRVLSATDTAAQTNLAVDLDSKSITIPDGAVGVEGLLYVREDDVLGSYEYAMITGKIGSGFYLAGGEGQCTLMPPAQSTSQGTKMQCRVLFDQDHIIAHSSYAVDDLLISFDAIGWLVWE